MENLCYNEEDEAYAEKIIHQQESFLAKVKIPEWLENAESPYKWLKSLSYKSITFGHGKLYGRVKDIHNQEDYTFEKFFMLITIGCTDTLELGIEFANGEDITDPSSVEKIDPEKTFKEVEQVVEEMRSREGDVMYTRIGAAIEHVLTATRANMLHLQGRDEESMQVARNLVPVENMSLECKAGFEGIKAEFLEYIYRNRNTSLEASKRAIELDPTFPFWKYTAAKTMRRIRRRLKQDVTEEELDYLESAVEEERNPKFLLWLAQVYQEMAQEMRDRGARFHVSEKLYQKATETYREIWNLKNDSAPILRRVGNGLLKIKSECRDLKLAEKALLKAVEISPDFTSVHHALGKLYLYHLHDEEKGLEYLTQAKGTYGAAEIIRYKLICDLTSDISEYIKVWAKHSHSKTCCDVVWYYLSFEHDVLRAMDMLWKVLKRNPISDDVLKFSSYTFMVQERLNLLELVVNEILLSIKEDRGTSEPMKDKEAAMHFLEKVYEKHPHLQDMTPDPDLLSNIKISVDIYRSKLKKQFERPKTPDENSARNWETRGNNIRTRNTSQERVKGINNHFAENWRVQNSTSSRNEEQNKDDSHNSWNKSQRESRRYSGENQETNSCPGGNGGHRYNEGNGGNRYNEGNRGNGYNEGNRGNRYNEGNRGYRYNEGNRENGYNEGNRGNGYNEGNRGNGYNEGNGGYRYNEGNRGYRYNEGNRENGYNEGNRGNGYNEGNRGNGYNEGNRGNYQHNRRRQHSGERNNQNQRNRASNQNSNRSRYDTDVSNWRMENRQ